MFVMFRGALAQVYDQLHTPSNRQRLEQLAVGTAAVGFVGHLIAIAVLWALPDLPETVLNGLDRSLLHAIYTPFSVILFYEVVLLVFSLANSHTEEISKQYQIISLIVVRRVFKDICSFGDIENWLAETDAVLAVLRDMGGAAAMFFLVTVFAALRKAAPRLPIERDLNSFIELKKAVAVLLLPVLIIFAAMNVLSWLRLLPDGFPGVPDHGGNVDLFFFPLFYEFMIFTDVFLLIVSLAYYDKYEYVFRNAGFVISTVLLRVSLSTPKPYDLALALMAMAYGVLILAIFTFFARTLHQKKTTAAPENVAPEER